MPEEPTATIFPASTVQVIFDSIQAFIDANSSIIIAVLAFAVGALFVMAWFTKSTRYVDSFAAGNERDEYEKFKRN